MAMASNVLNMPANQITFEANITSTTIPTNGAPIVSYAALDGGSVNSNEFAIIARDDGSLDIYVHTHVMNTGALATNLFDSTEHRLSVSWENGSGGVKVYIDGIEEFSATGLASGNQIDPNGTLAFGQEQDSMGGGFNSNQIFSGAIDDIRIFNDVRTASEIAANHDSQIADPTSEAGLVSNWQFDGESGSTITDLAGGNDLTISGDTSFGVEVGGDTIFGGAGNDELIGGAGADTLDGGAGYDWVQYYDSAQAVNIDLSDGSAESGGDAQGDIITNVEQIDGSNIGDDIITADNSGMHLKGWGGNDTLTGGTGDDTLVGGKGDDILTGGDGSDLFIFQEGDGSDTINGGAGASWTDTIQLQDDMGGTDIGTYGTDWTLTLTEGTIDSVNADSIDLSDDADGTITLQDGSSIDFTDIERIDW